MSPKAVGCSRWKEGCNFTIWRTQYGKELSVEIIKELLEKKETGVIEGFQKKAGNGSYSARLVMGEDFKVKLDFAAPRAQETQPNMQKESPEQAVTE